MSESAKLLKAHQDGCVVVCDMAPYKNWEVATTPAIGATLGPGPVAGTFRYSGHECKALTPAQLAWRLENQK